MATTTTKTAPTTEIPELAQKIREQLLSTVQQGQQLSIDAAPGKPILIGVARKIAPKVDPKALGLQGLDDPYELAITTSPKTSSK